MPNKYFVLIYVLCLFAMCICVNTDLIGLTYVVTFSFSSAYFPLLLYIYKVVLNW